MLGRMSPLAAARFRVDGTDASAGDSARGLRLGATALPLLAIVAGWALPQRRIAAAVLQGSAAVLPALALLMARAARHHDDQSTEDADPSMRVTVLVPARNEARAIGALIADLGAARVGPMELIVVDDGSRDATSDVAREAIETAGLADIAQVIRRPSPCGSKGAALRAAQAAATGVVIVVLDADARVEADFIGSVRAAARSGGPAQARRHMLPPADGRAAGFARLLAVAQDGEQDADDLIARARLRFGGAAELRGDGMVLPAWSLAAVGGWPTDALCEDLELSSRWYAATGSGVARHAGLDVWEQPVLSLSPLVAQRLRWAEGSIRRDLRVVLPTVADASVPFRRRLEVGAYASLALLPWAVAGLAARAAGPPWRRSSTAAARRSLVGLGAGAGLGALVLAWASDDRSPAGDQGQRAARLARAAGTAAFTGLWPLVLPAAWVRVALRPGRPRFSPTPHLESARFDWPARTRRPPT
jgi:hypothetical protein